ncbi:MAG TPA: baseplate J/gp47 family protein [Polyangiaceae bacterium]|jgi:hypothetical protein
MAAPVLPDALVVPSRDDIAATWKRDLQIAATRSGITISVADGSLPDLKSKVFADSMLPLYGEAARQSNVGTLDGKSGTELQQEAVDSGLPGQLAAAGASGFVVIRGATGGGFITAGAEIRNLATGKRYQSLVSGLYTPGSLVTVSGIDTGPSTNVAAGTILTWTSPPPGIDASATVFEDSDGNGLTGGRDVETDQQIRDRIRASRSNPAASGNDAAYQTAAMQTPGVGIQAVFTIPAILGPGSSCLLFLLRPASSGQSRVPNNAQIGLVKGYVTGQMPKGDSVTYGTVIEQSTDIEMTVVWATGVAQWTDGVPWPPFSAVADYGVSNDTVPTATSFSVSTSDPSPVTPQAGQTVALFDRTNLVFVEKRIGAVTTISAGHWTLTIDTTDNASDTQFTPAVLDPVSPWSDSLNLLPPLVAAYFDGLGPGEQVSSFFDAGYRQRRSPPDPQFWPISLTTKMLIPILQLSAIGDAEIKSPSLPHAPTVGTPGVSSNLLTFGRFAVLPG